MPPRPARRALLTLVTAGAALAAAAPGAAAVTCDRVAARDGADTNAGTVESPYRTAQKLANSLTAGQTGCLRAGTYDEQLGGDYVLRVNKADIALRSYPDERAKLRGVVFVPQGSDRVTLSDLDIDGRQSVATGSSTPVGVQVMALDTVIERNDITNNRVKSCMILGSNSGWGQAQRTIIRLNRFHDCGDPAHGGLDHSIYFQNVVDAEVTDNVFTRSAAYAIHLYPNADRNLVARNVIDGNARGVVFAGNSALTSDSNVVERNLITNSYSRYNVEDSWDGPDGNGNVLRQNCLHNGALGDLSGADGWTAVENLVADPQYVDRAAGDLRLRPGSPCLAIVGQDTAALVEAALNGGVPPAPAPAPLPEAVVAEPASAPVVAVPAPVVTEPVPAPAVTVTAPAVTQPASPPAANPSRSRSSRKASSSRRAKARAKARARARARAKAKRKRAAAKRRSARRAAGRR